jgi:hypothetical protein
MHVILLRDGVSIYAGSLFRYAKAKDSAVGTSFDEHVMGGYKVPISFSLMPQEYINSIMQYSP